MTYILTLCIAYSSFWGACGQFRQLEFPTLAACNAEREILSRYKDVSWATCAQKGKP